MNRIFLTFFALLFAATVWSQDTASVSPWKAGDFFVGVNSDITGIGITNLALSPMIGIAISANNIVYGSLFYAKEPRMSTFKVGWNKRVYYSSYVGVSTAIYSTGGSGLEWPKNISIEVGVFKSLFGWLMISPKLILSDTWQEGTNDFNLQTGVSFAVKL